MRMKNAIWMATSLVVGLGVLSPGVAMATDKPDGQRPGPSKVETDPNRVDPSSAPGGHEQGTTGTGNAAGGGMDPDRTDRPDSESKGHSPAGGSAQRMGQDAGTPAKN